MCPEVPQKRQSSMSRQHHCSWGVSFPSFLSIEERLRVVDFFCLEVEPLPWVELELFFCLDWEEPCCLTCVQTCFQRFWKYGFHGKLPHVIPSIMHQWLAQVSGDQRGSLASHGGPCHL